MPVIPHCLQVSAAQDLCFLSSWTYLLNSTSQPLLANLNTCPHPPHLSYIFYYHSLHFCLWMDCLFIGWALFTPFTQVLSCTMILGQELWFINCTTSFSLLTTLLFSLSFLKEIQGPPPKSFLCKYLQFPGLSSSTALTQQILAFLKLFSLWRNPSN